MGIAHIRQALGLAVIASLGFVSPAAAQQVEVRYSNWLPAGYFLFDKVIQPWMKEVEKVTEGRVTFALTPKAVGAVGASYDTVADGLADASAIVPAYTPGRFIKHDGIELPWMGDDPVKRTVASWNAYENYLAPAGEFKEIKVIALFSTNAAHIMTTGADVKTAADLKGLKLRSPSPTTTQAMDLLGVTPVLKPISELYELLSGKIIDGMATNPDAAVGFKLHEVLKKVVYLEGGLTATTTMIGMNKDTWNRISEKDRQAIDAISGRAIAEKVGEANLDNDVYAQGKMKEVGITSSQASDEMMAELRKITEPVRADWIAKAKAGGFDKAEEMLATFKKDYDAAPASK